MAFSIMQRELTAPDLEQLKRAFRSLPTLRDFDAQNSLNDAYGILLKGLEESDALTLQQALTQEGVPTEVVADNVLPAIPQAHTARAVEFAPEHLLVRDPLNRSIEVPWSQILFVSAGDVGVQEFKKVRTTLQEPQFHGSGITYDTIEEARSKEEKTFHLLADIFLVDGERRFNIGAGNFDFGYLDKRLSDNLFTNLAYFVQDLTQFAPHAGLNRGAFLLAHQGGELFRYPSKAAYYEEMTWMLWRASQL